MNWYKRKRIHSRGRRGLAGAKQSRSAAGMGWALAGCNYSSMFVNRVKEVEKPVGRHDRGIDMDVHDPGLRIIRPQLSVDKAGGRLIVCLVLVRGSKS
jgi:hypothetical protein